MGIAKDLFFSQQIVETLFSATNKLQMHGDKYLQNLTFRQMLAASAIAESPDRKASINYVAHQLGTSKQNAKQLICAMEKKGYLSITQNKHDQRAVSVMITQHGRQAYKKSSLLADEFLADIFCNFSPEEIETLCTLLQKLYCFDGQEQNRLDVNANYKSSEAVDILRNHQNFVKRRAITGTKKSVNEQLPKW